MTNLALVNLDDLRFILSENAIPNETWNSKKTADFFTTTIPTLLKEVEKGTVPAVRMGKDWKFSSIAMHELLRNGGWKEGAK